MGMNKVVIDVEARFTDHVTGQTQQAQRSIDGMGKAADRVQGKLNGLGQRTVQPTVGANTSPFLKRIEEAEGRAKRFSNRVYDAVIRIKDSAAVQTLGKIKSGLELIAKGAWTATVKIKDLATAPLRSIRDKLFNIKTLAAAVVGGALAQKFVKSPVLQYADYEDLVTQFGVILGSQEAAEKRMADLVKFAGQTPFTRDEIFQASRVLQTYTGGALATPDSVGGLRMIGDVAAATGQDYERVANYFGRLYNEVARGGKSLGEPLMMLREIGAISADNETAIQKIATGSGTIEEKWAQIAQQFSATDGMMEAMSNQMNNLLLGVKSFIRNNLWMRLGKGISESLKPFLADFRTWRNENSDLISGWADQIEAFAKTVSGKALTAVRNLAKRADELFRSEAFQNATIGGKIKLAWDTLVADPLRDWWNSGGREKTAAAANKIGGAIGGMLNGAILGVLGFTGLATEVGADGGSIANAFVQGFLDGFDGDAIKSAIKEALGNVWETFKGASLGGKIVTAGIVAAIGNKLLGPLFRGAGSLLRGGKGLLGKIFGGKTGTGGLAQAVSTMYVSAGVVYVNGLVAGGGGGLGGLGKTPIPIGGAVPEALPAGSAGAPLALPGEVALPPTLTALGNIVSKAIPIGTAIFAGVTALKGAQEVYRGGKLVEQGDTLGGYTMQGKGYSKLGAVGGGAMIGALGGPIGMLAGAGIGALGSWVFGDMLDYSAKMAEHAKQTHNIVKGYIGQSKNKGRQFEETPLADDTIAMKIANAVERAKYNARVGEYADIYKPGPYQTQTKGRQFEQTVERTSSRSSQQEAYRRYHTGRGNGIGGSTSSSGSGGYTSPTKGRVFEETVQVNLTPEYTVTGNGINWIEKVREDTGLTGPTTVEPPVFISPSYTLTGGNGDPVSMVKGTVPDTVGTSTWVPVSPSFSVTGKFSGSASAFGVKASYLFNTAVSVIARVATTIIGNPTADINAWRQQHLPNGRGFRGGIFGGPSSMQGFSDGGIVRGGARFIKVAEEGSPEMVIPLSSQRRDRGRKLWEKAGEMLKVPGFAQGGRTDGGNDESPLRAYRTRAAETPGSPGETHVSMGGVTVNLTVQAAPGRSVADEVRAQKDEIVNTVAGAINEALIGVFENTPRRGGAA